MPTVDESHRDPTGAAASRTLRIRTKRRRTLVWGSAVCIALGLALPVGLAAFPTASSTHKREPAVTLQEADGGVDYYGQFSHPLPSGESYFPIGVWYESVLSQGNIDKDKDVGLNLYVVLTTSSNLNLVRDNGMNAILQQSGWRDNTAARNNPAVAGWELDDEIDMQQADAEGAAAARQQLEEILADLPQDGRARYNNYGKGVAFWNTDADARRYVNDFQQLVSDDVYWFTDPGGACSQWEGGDLFNNATAPLTDQECRRASNYGAIVERMRHLADYSMPIWNFVEVGHPFGENDAATITPAQVRAAVWHSIIAGARGIIYFNHSFGGPCQTQHVLREPCYADVAATVKDVNSQIKSLAPVLNSPFVTSGWTHGSQTKAMVKWDGDHFYVFAGSTQGQATGQFSIPCVGDARATVLGESREIPATGGSFTDSFANGNAIHIYRIDGGSACGLPTADTRITSGPHGRTKDRTPTFGFESDETDVSFECRIDSKPFSSCNSPFTANRLALGRHRFRVRGTNADGPDTTPAKRRFRIVD